MERIGRGGEQAHSLEVLGSQFRDIVERVINQQRMDYCSSIVTPPRRDVAQVRVGNILASYATYCGHVPAMESIPVAGLEVFAYNSHLELVVKQAKFYMSRDYYFVRQMFPDVQNFKLAEYTRQLNEFESAELVEFAQLPHTSTRSLDRLLKLSDEEQVKFEAVKNTQ